jgi:hypothetical protein
MHASLLGFCLESLIIDNDMLGSINRNVRGIEVNDDTLSVEVIREVCLNGPGHYLGHRQTLSLMQKEYIYPGVGNRMSPKEWNEAGKPDTSSAPPPANAKSCRRTIPTPFRAASMNGSGRSTTSSCRARSWSPATRAGHERASGPRKRGRRRVRGDGLVHARRR